MSSPRYNSAITACERVNIWVPALHLLQHLRRLGQVPGSIQHVTQQSFKIFKGYHQLQVATVLICFVLRPCMFLAAGWKSPQIWGLMHLSPVARVSCGLWVLVASQYCVFQHHSPTVWHKGFNNQLQQCHQCLAAGTSIRQEHPEIHVVPTILT